MEKIGASELVKRFRNGDRDAFSAIYRAYHGSVFRFALYLTGDRERAGEIPQEVFVWRGDLGAFCGSGAARGDRRFLDAAELGSAIAILAPEQMPSAPALPQSAHGRRWHVLRCSGTTR